MTGNRPYSQIIDRLRNSGLRPTRQRLALARTGGLGPMALQGTIGDFGLPEILQLIGLQRKTGNLTLIIEPAYRAYQKIQFHL